MPNPVTIGLDVGQKRDPTAICVTEIEERSTNHRTVERFIVRHLESLKPGTSYPAIAQRLSELCRGIRSTSNSSPQLNVDATGLGQPIINLLREETTGLGSIKPVYFNHGDQRTEEGGTLRLGKAYLVSQLQMLLQTGRLHLPRGAEFEKLAQELSEYEIKVDSNANERYGAFRVGTRDELVTALGLSVDQGRRLVGVL